MNSAAFGLNEVEPDASSPTQCEHFGDPVSASQGRRARQGQAVHLVEQVHEAQRVLVLAEDDARLVHYDALVEEDLELGPSR